MNCQISLEPKLDLNHLPLMNFDRKSQRNQLEPLKHSCELVGITRISFVGILFCRGGFAECIYPVRELSSFSWGDPVFSRLTRRIPSQGPTLVNNDSTPGARLGSSNRGKTEFNKLSPSV